MRHTVGRHEAETPSQNIAKVFSLRDDLKGYYHDSHDTWDKEVEGKDHNLCTGLWCEEESKRVREHNDSRWEKQVQYPDTLVVRVENPGQSDDT